MSERNGGPEFPALCADGAIKEGMSLRDWFAGQALAGIIASYANPGAVEMPESEFAARKAYAYAAAMLAARKAKS